MMPLLRAANESKDKQHLIDVHQGGKIKRDKSLTKTVSITGSGFSIFWVDLFFKHFVYLDLKESFKDDI